MKEREERIIPLFPFLIFLSHSLSLFLIIFFLPLFICTWCYLSKYRAMSFQTFSIFSLLQKYSFFLFLILMLMCVCMYDGTGFGSLSHFPSSCMIFIFTFLASSILILFPFTLSSSFSITLTLISDHFFIFLFTALFKSSWREREGKRTRTKRRGSLFLPSFILSFFFSLSVHQHFYPYTFLSRYPLSHSTLNLKRKIDHHSFQSSCQSKQQNK